MHELRSHTISVGGTRFGGQPSDLTSYFHAPEWTEAALCAQADPEEWFADKGGTTRRAKQICADCPVRVECLTMALETDSQYGVFGGMSERDRRKIKKLDWRNLDLAMFEVRLPKNSPNAKPGRIIRCGHCHKTFHPAKSSTRYCSPECAHEMKTRRERERRARAAERLGEVAA